MQLCIDELEKDNKLIFCAGQAVAIRKNNSGVFYSHSYKHLQNYQNMSNKIESRLYLHSEKYSPIAHYSVWRSEYYINVTKKTISIHDLVPTSCYIDEILFELAADIMGNSKSIPYLYWIRNRINPPGPKPKRETGENSFKIIEKKLLILFGELDKVNLKIIMNSIKNNFNFIRSKNLIQIIVLKLKQNVRKVIKKKTINKIEIILNNNNIKFKKNDLLNLLNSMTN